MNKNFCNKNIINYKSIISPKDLNNIYPLSSLIKNNINDNINSISNIINKKDSRFLVICGPCSIHDYNSTIEYAEKLKTLSNKVNKYIFIVMRAYLEKPRTSIGWKGLINDPYINKSYNIEYGLKISRKLLINLSEINIPLATELLNPIIYKYMSDLYSWVSIGARTSESQIHREISSSLLIPVGFKNGTDGNIESSINSIKSSSNPNNFIYIDNDGKLCIFKTNGNKNCHIILRGGKNKPNYYPENVYEFVNLLKKNKVCTSIIIDSSHDNSYKNYKLQKNVIESVINQRVNNNNSNIVGVMIESNLKEGNQDSFLNKLEYGVSITDSCIGWEETENIINNMYKIFKNKN